jgi:hypothetical protein
VLSVYGLLWMLGLLASYRVYPHLVDAAGIRVRHSLFVDITIPGAAVAGARARRRLVAGTAMLQAEEHAAGRTLTVPVSGQTNVEVVLHEPTPLGTPDGPVTEVCLYADDVDAFLTAAQRQWRAAR